MDTALAVVTLVITFLTWLDEITWGWEHLPRMVGWCVRKADHERTGGYVHEPCRNYRVAGPESKV